MRGFEAIVAAMLVLAQPLAPQKPLRSPFAVERVGDTALLDRNAISAPRAAMIASLWPEARPCLIAAIFAEHGAPAELGPAFAKVQRPAGDARTLQASLSARFGSLAIQPARGELLPARTAA